MGRKPTIRGGGSTLSLYLSREQVMRLRAAAERRQITMSQIARQIIAEYFLLPAEASDPHTLREAS